MLKADMPTRLSEYCSLWHEQHLGTTIIRLTGEFDLASESRFQEELGKRLDLETQTFTLDLRGLEFIDSTGLRMLVQIDELARSDGFDFTVLCGTGQVRSVLQHTSLDEVLPLVDPSGSVPGPDSQI